MSLIVNNESTPAQPSSGSTEIFVNSSKQAASVDDANLVRVFSSLAGTETLSNKTLVLAAGTTAIAPETFAAGGPLTSPAIGAVEFDGTVFTDTIDLTSGRAQRCDQQIFRLTADITAFGPGIADYFGANSAFPTVLNGIYLLKFYCYFLKTTAGTVTWTLTHTQTYTNLNASYMGSPVGGIGAVGTPQTAAISKQTAAASALPVTGTLTTATDQYYEIIAIAECGTAGNIRLRITSGAGTVTPRRGSFYTAQRLFAGNVGTFVA